MTVDRGGLDYNIKTRGDFKALKDFRVMVADTKQELRSLIDLKKRAGLKSSASTSSTKKATIKLEREQNDILRRRRALNKEFVALRDKDLQSLKTGIAIRKKQISLDRQRSIARNKEVRELSKKLAITKETERLEIKLARLQNKTLQKKRTQLSIEQQIARFKQKQARFEAMAKFARSEGLVGNQQALSDLGFSKSRAQSMGLLAMPQPEIKSRFQLLKEQFGGLNRAASRAAASIQRMFTALVFFTAARGIVDGIRKMVFGMIEFNKALETANLGIAALLISTKEIKDPMGNVVKGAKALAVAQKLARQQTTQLRKEALKTAATFDDLVFAFQTAIAPGAAAGLTVDQTRAFSVLVSQAAGAMGLEQNQLAEEIRSTLRGNISKRNTRIATNLNIDSKDIRKAKEAGKLFEFLEEKFSGFRTAADETLNTFQGLYTNLRDAIFLVAGAGGIEFFETLKEGMKELRSLFVDKNLEPRPEMLKAFQQLGGSMRNIVEMLGDVTGKNGAEALATTLSTVGKSLELIAGVLTGIAESVAMIMKAISPVTDLAGNAQVGRIIGKMIVLVGALAAIKWLAMSKAFAAMTATFSKAGYFSLLAVTVILIAKRFQDIRESMGEINGQMATWGETWRFYLEVASTEFAKIYLRVQQFFTNIGFWFQKVGRSAQELFFSLSQIVVREVGEIINKIKSVTKQWWYGLQELVFSGLQLIFRKLDTLMVKMANSIFKGIKGLVDKVIGLLNKVPAFFRGKLGIGKEEMEFLKLLSQELGAAKPGSSPFGAAADAMAGLSADAKAKATDAAKPKLNPFAAALDSLAASASNAMKALAGVVKEQKAFNDETDRAINQMETDSNRTQTGMIVESRKRRGEKAPTGPDRPGTAGDKPEKALTFFAGLQSAWDEFIKQMPIDFTTAVEIAKGALDGLVDAISGTLTDALDPNKNSDDIKNRWQTFLKGLAKMILDTMVRLGIAKMLASFGVKGVGSGTTTAALGNAKGGLIQSFAHGGGVHGFGKASDPRDTVPAWLRPGEFVVRPEVVRKVGVGFMEALNSGIIQPVASLTGLSGMATAAKQRSAPLSMATGGSVPNMAAQQAPTMQVVPVMIAGESQLEQLLASGPSTFRNYLRANADAVQMNERRESRF